MTEAEWLGNSNWLALWHYALEKEYLSNRKRRLLAVAAAATVRYLFTDPRLERVAALSEARADLAPSELTEELLDAWEDAYYAAGDAIHEPRTLPLTPVQVSAAWATAGLGNDDYKVGRAIESVAEVFARQALDRAGLVPGPNNQLDGADYWLHPVYLAGWDGDGGRVISPLLRDIVGNPFRPVAFDPSWRTEAVVSLARGVYDSRDFAPLPVLADALEDAGCTDADVLAHCRGPGPHVRGCWVVDLELGKA